MLKRYAVSMMVVVVTTTGCMKPDPLPNDPNYSPVYPPIPAPAAPKNGSLFSSASYIDMYTDLRARRVGDILTVVLTETTTASKDSQTKLKKDNDTAITNPAVLGSTVQTNTPGILPLASNVNNNLGFTLDAKRDFEGTSDVTQNNKLTGTITVVVSQVLNNGNLVVRGEKWITLNTGDEYIRVSGIVRPQDIDEDNAVLSSKIADARITYSGTGPSADTNNLGWFARFFMSTLWPF